MEYKPDLDENSHHALLQQQIPSSFLDLQRGVRDLSEYSPVLYEEEFYQQFRKLFDDDDELNEAVQYLTLQGNDYYRLFVYIIYDYRRVCTYKIALMNLTLCLCTHTHTHT